MVFRPGRNARGKEAAHGMKGKLRGLQTALVALCTVLLASVASSANAQQLSWSQRMANTTAKRWPKGQFTSAGAPWRWNYELGVLVQGMDAVWFNTADGDYYNYVKQSLDQLVAPDGSIPTYKPQDNELDSIALGPPLLTLYRVTQDARYYKAATLLRKQLNTQPRTPSGGFWHKQKYANQMWLDGLYMAEPFYAEYASVFHQPADFKDITKQFVLIETHTRDPKTGLLYHGWDEAKQQPWANKTTGDSETFWARGMGWYMMALVDTLPYYADKDPGKAQLLNILGRLSAAVVHYQDSGTGLWYEVIDKPQAKGNYFESSASCMFTYALAKAVRLGYLPEHYELNAKRGYQGILKHFVQVDADGQPTLTSTVKAIDLSDHHSADYSYYVSQPVISNDPKGIGAFMLASVEMERAPTADMGRGITAIVDAWFNSQQRTNAAGQTNYFHYKWDDMSNSGFSFFGHAFHTYGVQIATLYKAPTVADLANSEIYIIVSPDIPKWYPNPHYMQQGDAAQVAQWVKNGGVLVMMENDPANADIEHLDLLATRFGIHFNNELRYHVPGREHQLGTIQVKGGGPLFHSPHTIYMKDTCTISVKQPATSLLTDKGTIVMAAAKYGKGTVYAVVDPWLYNEYTDGRKLPPEYDNFAAGNELVRWLVQQVPAKAHMKLH